MSAISSAGQESASAVAERPVHLLPPQDVAAGIIQPTEPVVWYVWAIEQLGGNKKYECKLCRM